MPKATTRSFTARKREPSFKERGKAKAGTAQMDQVPSTAVTNDPSHWRASKLRGSDTITKSNGIQQYHLKAADLAGIPFRTKETVVKKEFVRPMYIYKEQDIERRAWEKHGGPEGFDKHLAKLRARHLLKKNGPNAHFPQPKTYEDPRGGVQVRDMNIKKQMVPWLWIAFNKVLSAVDELDEEAMALGGGFFTKDKVRESPMGAALAVADTYPPRPPEKLPSSESVDRVRAVLAEAASPPEYGPDWGRDDIPGLTFRSWNCGPELVEEYEWSGDYFEHLFTALIQLIDELGLGREGLEGIRWEVYDKYVDCMHKGKQYDRRKGRWSDDAAEWLDGQFTKVGILLDVSCRGKCPAGRKYNDMLPFCNPSGSVSVGVRPH